MEIEQQPGDPHERPLTAEEKVVGSDDPVAQSEAIMDDSDERAADREASPGTFLEHRTSAQATPPPDDEAEGRGPQDEPRRS